MNYRGNADVTYHLIVNPGQYRLTLQGVSVENSVKEVTVNNSRQKVNFYY
jgi:hypothetical protein